MVLTRRKGFGFISNDDGGEDVLFHFLCHCSEDGYKTLTEARRSPLRIERDTRNSVPFPMLSTYSRFKSRIKRTQFKTSRFFFDIAPRGTKALAEMGSKGEQREDGFVFCLYGCSKTCVISALLAGGTKYTGVFFQCTAYFTKIAKS